MSKKIKNFINALIMIPLLGIGAIICVEGVIAFNIPDNDVSSLLGLLSIYTRKV